MEKNHLIEKWVTDQLTDEEAIAFNALEEAPFYKSIIEDAARFKASNFSEMPSYEAFKERISVEHAPVKTNPWIRPLLRMASISIILIGLYFMFFSNKMIEVETLAVEKTTIELPDASRVVLNALSEISYDKKKWNTNRSVALTGEAFFDVAKGAKFDVVTTKGTVSVLGTEFNVKQRGTLFVVVCYEGTVQVTTDAGAEILEVGDSYTSINGQVSLSKHAMDSPQWINNMSQFDRLPLSEVLAELERQYGITIKVENIDTSQLFTGGFVHGNLNSALISISEPLGLEYEVIKPDIVRLSMSD